MLNRHTIRLVSTNTHDQLVMKSLLSIIGQRACKNWSYAEDNVDADVIVVDVDNEYPDIATLQRNNRCHTIVSFSEKSRYVPQMSFSLSKPLRAKDVLVLLGDIERILAPSTFEDLTSKIPEKTSTNSAQKAFTSSKVLDQLLNATKQYKGAIVEVDLGNQFLYLDNRRKKIFISGLFVASQLTERQITCRAIDKVPFTALESLTFTDLFYELTLSQSSASLANDLSANDEFTIRQWPNMVHSRHAKNMIRMAAYFSKQKATVSQAARDLALELNDIIGFLNAAYSQDLVVSHPAMALASATLPSNDFAQNVNHTNTEVPTKTSSGLGGLFGRIRQKFGL